MTAAPSQPTDTEALAGMTRSQYLDFKLRQDFTMMAWIVFFVWLLDLAPGYVGCLAAIYLLMLLAARSDHGRKWDRAHVASASIRQPGK
jgi:hypothetical protein